MSYDSIVLADGPVAYWKLDEVSGTTINDSLSTYNGTITGTYALDQNSLINSGKSILLNGGYIYGSGTPAGVSDQTAFSIELWCKFSDISNVNQILFDQRNSTGSNSNCGLQYRGDTGKIRMDKYLPTGSQIESKITPASNKIYHIVYSEDATNRWLYINGELDVTDSSPETFSGSNMDRWAIGAQAYTFTETFKGDIQAVAVYDYALTAEQVLTHYLSGISEGYLENILRKEPVAYYKLDETSGTTVYDSSSNSNNGAYVNSALQGVAPLISEGYSVDFEYSTSDYITIGGSHPIGTLVNGKSSITIEAWIKIESIPANMVIFTSQMKDNSSGFALEILSSDSKLRVYAASNSSDTVQSVTSTAALSTATLYHIVGVIDFENDSIKLYINGVLNNSASTTFGSTTYTVGTHSNPDTIGGFQSSTYPSGLLFFDGIIDEVAVYDYKLNDYEILKNYQTGLGKFQRYEKRILEDYPIAYWKLDELSGTTANDETINGNNGTYVNTPTLNTLPLITTGKSVSFNGTNWVSIPTLYSPSTETEIVIEAWVVFNGVASSQIIFYHGDNGEIQLTLNSSGYVNFGVHIGASWYFATDTDLCVAGKLYHFIGVWKKGSYVKLYANGVLKDTNISAPDSFLYDTGASYLATIGSYNRGGGGEINGIIDEVAVYNHIITDEQILAHYQVGKDIFNEYELTIISDYPVAYYKFDEISSSFAYDESINSNDGVYFDAPRNNAPGLTYDGRSVDFEKDNTEGIDIGSTTQPIGNLINGNSIVTIEAWIRIESLPSSEPYIIFSSQVSDGYIGFTLFVDNTTQKIGVSARSQSGDSGDSLLWTSAATIDTTYHIVGVIDYANDTLKLYVNGDLTSGGATFGATTYTLSSHSRPDTIGYIKHISATSGTNWFDGLIDELAVYDYELSQDQVTEHYNLGIGVDDTYAAEIKSDSPLAYWKSNEKSGTFAFDHSKNALFANYVGSPTMDVTGLINSNKDETVTYLGSGDYLYTQIPGSYLPENYTFECWFNPDIITGISTSVNRRLFSQYRNDISSGLSVGIEDSKVGLWWYDGTTGHQVTGSTLVVGETHHLAMVVDRRNKTIKVYLDGVIDINQSSATIVSGGSESSFIGSYDGATYEFLGEIDDPAIYNYALTSSTILSHYTTGSTQTGEISATTDTLTITEYQATVTIPSYNISANYDQLNVGVYQANVKLVDFNIVSTYDQLLITEYSADIVLGLGAGYDTLSFTTYPANVELPIISVNANIDTLTITEYPTNIVYGIQYNIDVKLTNRHITTYNASVELPIYNINTTKDSLLITEWPANVELPIISVNANIDELIITGQTASIDIEFVFDIDSATYNYLGSPISLEYSGESFDYIISIDSVVYDANYASLMLDYEYLGQLGYIINTPDGLKELVKV